MALVTLLGEKQAGKGTEFIYLGPSSDCKNCKLKNVCFNLKKGRHYEVTKVRDKHHDCSVHEKGVRVVEVKELPIVAAVDEKIGKNNKVKGEGIDCEYSACVNYEACNPRALQSGKQYKVKKIIEKKMDCTKKKKLKKAELSE